MNLLGKIRRIARSFGDERTLRMTNFESLASAQVEPSGFELNRAGLRYMLGNSAAITGIAPVQALPTTAAQWVLWNADGTYTYYFEELGVYLTSGTPGVGGMLLACILQAPAQTGNSVAGASVSRTSRPVASGGGSAMIVKSSVTITTPAAPTWYPIASNPSPNVTAFASSTFLEHRNIQGRISVPPGYGLGLAVVAPAGTTPLFAPFGKWCELDSDNE